MTLHSRIMTLAAALFVAVAATGANAAATINDLVFGNLGQPGSVPVYSDPLTPIILEDDLGTSVAVDEFGTQYVLGVVDIQALRRGDGQMGDIRTIGKTTPSASVTGNGSSLTALVFGIIEEVEPGVFVLEPVNAAGPTTVTTTSGDVVTVNAFSNNALVQVYFEMTTDILALQDPSDDVANVTTGSLVAEFGFTGEGDEYYNLGVSGPGIDGFELSLNLIGANNTGVPIGRNNLGTHLYGVKELEDESSNSKWDIVDDSDFKIVVIPTPAALPAGLALVGLVAARRRRSA